MYNPFKMHTTMKKMMFTLIALLTIAASASAMSYEQARREALFLTDKMAYELNLSDVQYEAAYEINLDYLMGVTSQYDVFGPYWERRNLDLSYILFSWQWDMFRAATYFYRPLIFDAGYWHFSIYARYPHRDYYYFGRPHFYATYRGGHSWRMNNGRSFYEGRRNHYRPEGRPRDQHWGMRNGWDRGDYRDQPGGPRRSTNHDRGYDLGNNRNGDMQPGGGSNSNRGFGSGRNGGDNRNNGNAGLGRNGNGRPDNGNAGVRSDLQPGGGSQFSNGSGNFGGSRPSGSGTMMDTRSNQGSNSSAGSSGGSRIGGSFGGNRSVGSPAGSVRENTPAVRQGSPAVRQSTPAVRQSAPAVRQSTPAVRQSAPAVRQSSGNTPARSSGSFSGGSRSSGGSSNSSGNFGGGRRR